MKRDLKSDQDFSAEEVRQIFQLAKKVKEKQKKNEPHEYLKNKSLAMIFQKPSTRTRVSFEVAMTHLGGHALYLNPNDLQLSRGETIADTTRTLSRYVHGIMARVFSHQDILDLARFASVPVINGLSDKFHPCQSLTDIFTIWEKLSYPEKFPNGFTIVFVGDGNNNVTNSLLLLCARLGINFRVGCPKKYQTKTEILELAKADFSKSGSTAEITNDVNQAVKGANVLYTDVWISMGRQDAEKRKKILVPYQVNQRVLSLTKKKTMVMHCLPAHRGEEITDEVIDGPNSIVFDQAENRLHVQKAILIFLLQPKSVVNGGLATPAPK
ncbi:MAG: ornithine carbamoyltransferase [Patescibacteria group bacterium]|nr:ornithine carbamoyltransferase [Patescibacteria group bacterium]